MGKSIAQIINHSDKFSTMKKQVINNVTANKTGSTRNQNSFISNFIRMKSAMFIHTISCDIVFDNSSHTHHW